jgi:CRP/FNR family cyclic AMP-dependent transcriptional regulator
VLDPITVEDLRCCELFPDLSDEELADVAAIARRETYQVGDPLCAERELADRLFILETGRVRVQIQFRSGLEPNGDMVIEEVESGRIFGWSSLVRQRRFTASAQALEPVSLIVIKAQDLEALFDRDAHLGFVVMKQLAEVIASRLRHTRDVCEARVPQG